MVAELKVPGRKAKSYEQQYVRTMIFDKIDASHPHYTIDGIKYDLTSVAVIDTFKYKGFLCEIYDFVDPDAMEMSCTFESYNSWNKDLNKLLK